MAGNLRIRHLIRAKPRDETPIQIRPSAIADLVTTTLPGIQARKKRPWRPSQIIAEPGNGAVYSRDYPEQDQYARKCRAKRRSLLSQTAAAVVRLWVP